MLPLHELLIFATAAFGLVITPGPNMLYLISRSISQGRGAGLVSLLGVLSGFIFHTLAVSLGLTAIFMAVPTAYYALKVIGVTYLLYLAWQAVKPNGRSAFETNLNLPKDSNWKLFQMGFLTNVLNPKAVVFYFSFFPQFMKPEYGALFKQGVMLGLTQMSISFTVNALIVLTAAQVSVWFAQRPTWVKAQRYITGSILAGLAVKMALDKGR
jgi:threonine/homoserine/homoserine lactone efflux protein